MTVRSGTDRERLVEESGMDMTKYVTDYGAKGTNCSHTAKGESAEESIGDESQTDWAASKMVSEKAKEETDEPMSVPELMGEDPSSRVKIESAQESDVNSVQGSMNDKTSNMEIGMERFFHESSAKKNSTTGKVKMKELAHESLDEHTGIMKSDNRKNTGPEFMTEEAVKMESDSEKSNRKFFFDSSTSKETGKLRFTQKPLSKSTDKICIAKEKYVLESAAGEITGEEAVHKFIAAKETVRKMTIHSDGGKVGTKETSKDSAKTPDEMMKTIMKISDEKVPDKDIIV